MFSRSLYPPTSMDDKLTPADPRDTADSVVAFALLFSGKKRVPLTATGSWLRLSRSGIVAQPGALRVRDPEKASNSAEAIRLNKPPGWPHTSREKSEMSG